MCNVILISNKNDSGNNIYRIDSLCRAGPLERLKNNRKYKVMNSSDA